MTKVSNEIFETNRSQYNNSNQLWDIEAVVEKYDLSEREIFDIVTSFSARKVSTREPAKLKKAKAPKAAIAGFAIYIEMKRPEGTDKLTRDCAGEILGHLPIMPTQFVAIR